VLDDTNNDTNSDTNSDTNNREQDKVHNWRMIGRSVWCFFFFIISTFLWLIQLFDLDTYMHRFPTFGLEFNDKLSEIQLTITHNWKRIKMMARQIDDSN